MTLEIASNPTALVSLCEIKFTANPSSRDWVGSVKSGVVQCIKGYFIDDKNHDMTYHLLLCPPICLIPWDSRGPQQQCGIWNQHTGAKTTKEDNLKRLQFSLPAGHPWSPRPGPEMLSIPMPDSGDISEVKASVT